MPARDTREGSESPTMNPTSVERSSDRELVITRTFNAPPRLVFANFWVRFDTGQAFTNEGEVSLSDKELRLMEVFSANENRALTRTDLLEEVWGMDQFPTDRTVDNFILRLRKLFEPDPENPVHIVTLRGRGYLFRSAP